MIFSFSLLFSVNKRKIKSLIYVTWKLSYMFLRRFASIEENCLWETDNRQFVTWYSKYFDWVLGKSKKLKNRLTHATEDDEKRTADPSRDSCSPARIAVALLPDYDGKQQMPTEFVMSVHWPYSLWSSLRMPSKT